MARGVECARRVCLRSPGCRMAWIATASMASASVLYGIPNFRVEYHPPEAGIPVGYWRSVGYSQNTFFTESFIDEMAAAGGKDPVEFRRKLAGKSARVCWAS